MAAQDFSPREFRSFRVRRWVDFTVAPLARWVWTDGNSFDVTIAGTASDGTYTVTIVPSAVGVTVAPIVVTRTAGAPATNTNLAAQMVTETNTLLAAAVAPAPTALATYIASASNVAGVVSFIVNPNAPPFTVTVAEVTATGTIALAPNDTFPITMSTLGLGPTVGARTHLEIAFVPTNASGVPVDPGAVTADVTVRRMIDRKVPGGTGTTVVGVTSATTTAAHPIATAFRIAAGGGRYAFALGALSATPTNATALEVWVREVTG